MQMLLNWGIGLSNVFLTPVNLLLLLLGTLLGMIVGALPGLNSPIAMSIMIPLTYGMDPGAALCILAGIYTGSTCGGSVSSILLEVPGTGAAVVTAFDGHEMYRKGQGGLALGISSVSSVVGGIIAAIVLGACAPFVAAQALKFGAPEYLMLSVMGFASVIGMSNGRMSKNIMAMLIGLLISVIGISPQGGIKRFTFGTHALLEGIPLVPMLIGMFGIGAIISTISDMKLGKTASETVKQTMQRVKVEYPDRKMIKSFLPIWAQSSVIGNIVGAIPGAGMTVAIFMAYDQVKRYRRDLEFGTGIPEGVAAPECANKAVVGSSMIPLLALGVPGNPASSLFLGALLIHGLRTGPKFFVESSDVAYTLIAAFFTASIALLPVMHIFVNYMATYVLRLRYEVLNGLILILCVTGAFATGNNDTYIVFAIVFGVIGFVLKKFHIPFGPLVLATVLGSMLESYYIQSMVTLRGNFSGMLQRPICVGLLLLSVFFLLMPLKRFLKKKKGEIKVIKAWVEIKNWALKNRIQIHEEIPQELLEFKVIKFCLQPLVENSVLHGMEHVENGEIWIRAFCQGNRVCIVIQDNGIGMDEERLREIMADLDINRKRRHVTGIGLTSIHELMQVKYGPEFGLAIESEIGAGTKVYVHLPYERKDKNHAEGSDCG